MRKRTTQRPGGNSGRSPNTARIWRFNSVRVTARFACRLGTT